MTALPFSPIGVLTWASMAFVALTAPVATANTQSIYTSPDDEVALKITNLRRSMRQQILSIAEKDCKLRPLACHEYKTTLDMLSDDVSFSKEMSTFDFTRYISSLERFVRDQDGSRVFDEDNALANVVTDMVPMIQSLKAEWVNLYSTMSLAMPSVFASEKVATAENASFGLENASFGLENAKTSSSTPRRRRSGPPSQDTILPSRARTHSQRRLNFVNDMISSAQESFGSFSWLLSPLTSNSVSSTPAASNTTSFFSLSSVLESLNTFATGEGTTTQADEKLDNISSFDALNISGPDALTVEGMIRSRAAFNRNPARAAFTTSEILPLYPLDAKFDEEYKSVPFPSSSFNLSSLDPDMPQNDVSEPEPQPEEQFPCNFGREASATKTDYTCNGKNVSKERYNEIFSLPVLVPDYPGSLPFSQEKVCTQVDFFFDNTFLGEYLVTILTVEEIAELADRDAPRQDYIFAVCSAITKRPEGLDVVTKTDTNENYGEGGMDYDWCLRNLDCETRNTCSTKTQTRQVCLCPYGFYGPRCATPTLRTCRLELSEKADISGCGNGIVPMGSQWDNFDNRIREDFLPLRSHANCISAQAAGNNAVALEAQINCRFSEDIYQGIIPSLVRMMGLDGYEWDTNYNFPYSAYRPASLEPEASYEQRDEPAAPTPLFAMIDESKYPKRLATNTTISAIIRPINWDKLSDMTLATELPLSQDYLSSFIPPTLTSTIDYTSVLATKKRGGLKAGIESGSKRDFSPYIPGGRTTWEARVLVKSKNAFSHKTSGLSWTVEDVEFQPGPPRRAPLTAWEVVAIVVCLVALLIGGIFAIRAYLRSREEKFFQQRKHVSMQEAQDRAALAVFAIEDENENVLSQSKKEQ